MAAGRGAGGPAGPGKLAECPPAVLSPTGGVEGWVSAIGRSAR